MTTKKALPLTLLLFALFAFAGPLRAQGTDCTFTYTFTGDSTQTGVSNLSKNTPCVNWRLTLTATGTLTTTVTFQTSPDNSTWTAVPNTVCSSSVQPPCILQGANPITGTQGMMYVTAYGSYVRVVISSSSGSGTGTVRAYGAKGASANAGTGGGGGSGSGTVTDTLGPLTLNAVILGNGGNDIQPGAVLPGSATKYYDGTGSFSTPPASGTLTYYATNTASDIATYLQLTGPPFTPKTTVPFTGLATGTDTLQNWSTNAGVPGLTFIPAGAYIFHVHANRTGIAGTITIYGQFWEISSLGVDIAQIGQTESSANLTTTETEFSLAFANGNVYTLASSASRIVIRLFAVVSPATGPTVNIFVGGTADTHISLPSNTVDASNFVPYTGAVSDLNMGPHAITTGSGGTSGQVTLTGASSGSATIQAATAQGTPQPVQLPTSTGTSGYVLSTDGGTPQQLSWIAPGAGTLGNPYLSPATPVPIVAANWADFNMALCSRNTSGNFEQLVSDASAGNNICGRTIAFPAGAFSRTLAVIPNLPGTNYATVGFGVTDGIKVSTCSIQDSAGIFLNGAKCTAAVTCGANYSVTSPNVNSATPQFFRMADDGAGNLSCRWSPDGSFFQTLWTDKDTTGAGGFMTPTKLIYFVNAATSSKVTTMTVISYQ